MLTKTLGPALTARNTSSDNFDRASLGSAWTVTGNGGIVASTDLGATGTGQPIVMRNGDIAANQYCEATLAAGIIEPMMAQVCVRYRGADAARYGFYYLSEPTEGVWGRTGWVYKYDGVASELTRYLAISAVGTPIQAPGDRVRIEARGSGATVNLRGYLNGLLILEYDDTHADRIVGAGNTVLAFRSRTGSSPTYPTPVYADWSAGELL